VKIIPSHGIWNLLPGSLTRRRLVGKRTKIALWVIIAIGLIAGYFEPGIEGFYDWMTHRKGLYESSHIKMPVFWRQELWDSWKRPSVALFSEGQGGLYVLDIGPNGFPSKFLFNAKGVTDGTNYPELLPLLKARMKCRWNEEYIFPGDVEVWCASSDGRRMFHYTGPRSYLPGAVSIIQQIN